MAALDGTGRLLVAPLWEISRAGATPGPAESAELAVSPSPPGGVAKAWCDLAAIAGGRLIAYL
jgi:hypothetical protein